MIAIGNTLVSDEVLSQHFACHLEHCKGQCCIVGDAGAPLTDKEAEQLPHHLTEILPYLSPEGIAAIEAQGTHTIDSEFDKVTPLINNGICAYGTLSSSGAVVCGIEAAYRAGATVMQKPISCHLFPLRIKATAEGDIINYEPFDEICNAGCLNGERLQIPVYVFVKDALIRRYGSDFYEALSATDHFLRS